MAEIAVTVAGRSYRIACGEGEERHLENLASYYDGKIEEMRRSFGEIGDMRLHVMAAITIADEMSESRSRIAALEGELAGLRALASEDAGRARQAEARFTASIQTAAETIERLTLELNASI